MHLLWLIPLLPAAGAALNGLIGIRWFERTVSGVLACAAMAAAFALSVWALAGLLALPPGARVHELTLGDWITPIPLATAADIGMFKVPWSLRLDPLSAVMLLVVTGIGFLIHVYATAYMKDEPRTGYARFFCYMNLFCACMLLLVLAGNFLVMFVGWEGVGLCSYLLIGFWHEKRSAANAGKKAFLVNRIGDWGLLLGVFLVFYTFGTLDFREVAAAAAARPAETAGFGVLSAICLLLFAGATAKSAQIPLFVWLPDAMEGPTPVSALIHAATMVTAGVYIVARNAVLFERAPLVMQIVAIVGALTALMAATMGLVQHDIKRVLAYSTISQLGYMFLATGVGAFAAAVFHLVTHACVKALLFLGTGSVIHAEAGEQDLHRMGGLKALMPVTFVSMMIGTLAIAGIPPFAGFFSKDEILVRTFAANRVLWGIGAATAALTGCYMFRLMALTFYGSHRGPAWHRAASPDAAAQAAEHGVLHPLDARAHGFAELEDHEVTHGPADASGDAGGDDGPGRRGPREVSGAMPAVLLALAVGAIATGFVGVQPALGGAGAIQRFLAPSFSVEVTDVRLKPDATGITGIADVREPSLSRRAQLGLTFLSILIATAGLLAGRHYFVVNRGVPTRLAEKWPGVLSLLLNKYYLDELYRATIVRPTVSAARALWRFDRGIVDGAVNGWGAVTRIAAWCSHMFDKYVVDGLVTLTGWSAGRGSFVVRLVQTGLVQNYALWMVLGLFAFLTLFLLVR